jgi:hypothetical protein
MIAGAKHGTMSSSNIARVTGSGACLSLTSAVFAATAAEEGGGTDMSDLYAAAMTWISIL